MTMLFLGVALPIMAVVITQSLQRERALQILVKEAKHLHQERHLEIANTVTQLGWDYEIDPLLIMAVIHVESHFKPSARSQVGALGLMQIRPIVVREVADELGLDPKEDHKLLGGEIFNLRVGIHFFSTLLKKFKGDTRKALLAYNMGPTAVSRLYRHKPIPATGYHEKVMKVYRAYLDS